jgi:IclR family pca regulon transcriptional regulator
MAKQNRLIAPFEGELGQRVVPTLREARYSQSLERGLMILAFYTPERPVMGVAEIADELGMGRSTTHRYMATLVELGFLEQVQGRKYRLGLHVTDLGMSALAATGLAEHSRELLEQLRSSSGYTASLAVLDGPEIIYVDRALSRRRGQHLIDHNLRVGSRLAAYATAMGKLLLAHIPDPELQRQVLGEMTLTRRTPHTITTRTLLRRELESIVLEGAIAVSDQEYTAGLVEIAAAVRGETGEVVAAAGLEAHVSMISLEELAGRLGPHLTATADRISARLGYRRADERPQRR